MDENCGNFTFVIFGIGKNEKLKKKYGKNLLKK